MSISLSEVLLKTLSKYLQISSYILHIQHLRKTNKIHIQYFMVIFQGYITKFYIGTIKFR